MFKKIQDVKGAWGSHRCDTLKPHPDHVHLDSILTFNDKLENQEHRCLTLLYTERNKSH